MYIFADLLTLCFHEAGVRSEVALLFLYLFQILWFLSEVGVFTFVMKDLDVYRALLSLGSETRIDRVSVGFQVEFVVSGLLLILLFKSIFPSRQTQRQQPSQRLIIQLPQLLTVNSLLKIPLSVCILLSSLSSYLTLGWVKQCLLSSTLGLTLILEY